MAQTEKTEALNRLFAEWKEKYCSDAFVEDGIICEGMWNTARRKVMFLLKETNQFVGDFRELAFHKPWLRLGRWAYGLQHSEPKCVPDFAVAEDHYRDAYRSSAVVNLKKLSGGSTANAGEIRNAALNDAQLLVREIQIIAPDIVVCGGTLRFVKTMLGMREVSQRCFVVGATPWIDFWHPSYRKVRVQEAYDRLMQVYQGHVCSIKGG